MSTAESWKRFVPAAQAMMVRSYKVVGLLALTGILLGLLSFLVVNGFYLFDHTWVRPVILAPSHERVREFNRDLQAEMTRREALVDEKAELSLELGAIARRIEANQKFEDDAAAAKPVEDMAGMLARREVDSARLERLEAVDRKTVVERKITVVDAAIARYDGLIEQYKDSPYAAAVEREVVVAFVPYENLENVRPGVAIFGCKLNLFWCSEVGQVVSVLEGEVTNTHPQDNTSERGRLLEITLSQPWAAEERALFVGGKPFWIL